jgi:hypothetical protein
MKLQDLFEARIGSHKVDAAMTKVISYLERAVGARLIKVPGVEHFKNSKTAGWGLRYVFDGSTKCIRFNWESEPKTGKSSSIMSIDVFDGKKDPSYTMKTDGISFVKILPALAGAVANPKKGTFTVFAAKPEKAMVAESEAILSEAKRGEYTYESALKDFLIRIKKTSCTRTDWIVKYHISTVEAFDVLVNGDYDEQLVKQGKRIQLAPGVDTDTLAAAVLAHGDGELLVTAGGTNETYQSTSQEELEDPADRIPFADSLEHLQGLTQGLIKGSFNALFVAGKGGTGKTQTVEDTLHEAGLRDGDGYFKNTGSASAIGIYSLLFHHRKDIILFDDSDGALADQDARNLIKAATDTKKIRKLVWNKKSSNMIDPEFEDVENLEDDDDRIPKYFNFEGRIIFISNLSLNKLDPDKALRTRAFVISINPTPEELLERMEQILHKIPLEDGLSLTKKQRENVLGTVKEGKRREEVSLRTLVRALNLAASGAANWETLVKLYA